MGRFSGALVLSDLDGTLLNSQARISQETLEAIEEYTNEGGIFTFVTGRVPFALKEITDQYFPRVPIGCINGAGIYDLSRGEYLWQVSMGADTPQLVAYLREHLPDVGLEICGFHYNRYERANRMIEMHMRAQGLSPEICTYEDFGAPVSKLFLCDEPERLPHIIEVMEGFPLKDRFEFVSSNQYNYELLPKGASKGDLALRIANLLGISHDRVFAVGDNENDISMIKAAKVGFAVANATPNAKAAADVVLESDNDHHAVAEMLYRLPQLLK